MSKLLRQIELGADTLSLSECTDGFWLWDETREMNLSMKAKTAQAALVETILYYQRRLSTVEEENRGMFARIGSALAALGANDDTEE